MTRACTKLAYKSFAVIPAMELRDIVRRLERIAMRRTLQLTFLIHVYRLHNYTLTLERTRTWNERERSVE